MVIKSGCQVFEMLTDISFGYLTNCQVLAIQHDAKSGQPGVSYSCRIYC